MLATRSLPRLSNPRARDEAHSSALAPAGMKAQREEPTPRRGSMELSGVATSPPAQY